MRVWDTGPTPGNPRASTRIVQVTLAASSTLGLRVRTTGSLTRSEPPATVMGRYKGDTVFINGGVFDPTRGAIPDGAESVGGQLVKARSTQDPTLTITSDGRTASPDHVSLTGTARVPGASLPVTGLNWQTISGTGVNVWTTAWGGGRRPFGTADVVLIGGKVTAVRTGNARGAAPLNGQAILSATGATGSRLAGLRPGTAVSLSYHGVHDAMHPVYSEIGRGRRYLLNGSKQGGDCNARDEELRPRTAIGFLRTGRLFLLTVSGRSIENGVIYGGATHHQMPDYLAALGAYNAAGEDGGGSTAMYVRTNPGGMPVRVDRTVGFDRSVPNFLTLG